MIAHGPCVQHQLALGASHSLRSLQPTQIRLSDKRSLCTGACTLRLLPHPSTQAPPRSAAATGCPGARALLDATPDTTDELRVGLAMTSIFWTCRWTSMRDGFAARSRRRPCALFIVNFLLSLSLLQQVV